MLAEAAEVENFQNQLRRVIEWFGVRDDYDPPGRMQRSTPTGTPAPTLSSSATSAAGSTRWSSAGRRTARRNLP
jgi:hypothetical protein